jgi:nitric oxide reductase subunit B
MGTIRKLWLGLAALLTGSFAVLLWVGSVVHRQAPSLPTTVVTSEGQTLYTKADLELGPEVWQSIGGQQLGSIWGHGALLAPDWSADWMHSEATTMLELRAHDEDVASFTSLSADRQAALKARIAPELATCVFMLGIARTHHPLGSLHGWRA